MTPQAIAFDLDGTLIDSAPKIALSANAALVALGYTELAPDVVRGFVGNGVAKLSERCLRACGETPDGDRIGDMKALVEAGFETDPCAATTLYPGVIDLLHAISASGIPMAIVTNKPEHLTLPVLEGMGIAQYFDVVIGGAPPRPLKPDPAPLFAGVQPLVSDPAQALFVGDSEVDAATGAAAGIPTALFTGGYRKTPISELPHDIAFDHHDALRTALFPG